MKSQVRQGHCPLPSLPPPPRACAARRTHRPQGIRCQRLETIHMNQPLAFMPALLVSRHRSDVVGCAQPSERSARRIAWPYPAVLASDPTPRCASMASADRQMIGDATPACAAQAQSSVTVFGALDAALTHSKGSVASGTTLSNNNGGASKLGFRGVEDLGGGLEAGFWIEGAIFPDSGAGGATNTNNQPGGEGSVGGPPFGRRDGR